MIDGYHIKAVTHEAADITLTAGCSNVGAVFEDLVIHGTQGGDAHFVRCNIPVSGLYNAEGEHIACTYRGHVSTVTDGTIEMLDGFSAMPGNAHPYIICNGNVSVGIRNFSGGIGVENLTAGHVVLGINTGYAHLHDTCTGGNIFVRGTGGIMDESAGATVDLSGYINIPSIAAGVWNKTLP